MQIFHIAFIGPEIFHVFAGRLHVVAGIDGEQQHVDQTRSNGQRRDVRIMAAQSEKADPPLLFQPLSVLNDLAVEHRAKILFRVDIMNHADVDVIRPQTRQQIPKSPLRPDGIALTESPVCPRALYSIANSSCRF